MSMETLSREQPLAISLESLIIKGNSPDSAWKHIKVLKMARGLGVPTMGRDDCAWP